MPNPQQQPCPLCKRADDVVAIGAFFSSDASLGTIDDSGVRVTRLFCKACDYAWDDPEE